MFIGRAHRSAFRQMGAAGRLPAYGVHTRRGTVALGSSPSPQTLPRRYSLRRFSLLVTTVVALLFGAGPAFAGPGSTTGGDHAARHGLPCPMTVAIDPVLAKLNTLEDQLDAMTTKLNAATAKLDALTTKTHDIWQTTHFTKGYLQNGIPTIFDMIERTCWVASQEPPPTPSPRRMGIRTSK